MTEHADRRTDHCRHESDAGPSSEDGLAEAAHQDLINEVRALRTRVDDLEAQNTEYRERLEERLEKMTSAMDDEDVQKTLAVAKHIQQTQPEDVEPELLTIDGRFFETNLRIQRNQDRLIDELQARRMSR